MIPTIIKAMEPHIKRRYDFVMSSFVRMHGNSVIHNHDIKQFCIEWSYREDNAPLQGLDEVDQYMYYEYKNWRGR
jgi:hypothetical protein